MSVPEIRAMLIGDAEPVRSLNQTNVAVTSPMDADHFRYLHAVSELKWVVEVDDQVVAVCAEIDIDPPNEGSLRFHDKAGFVQVGTRELESGKRVSMQLKMLADQN